jgi:hypothetical protein
MPWVGFEPTITALERAKTVHAVDRSAAVIGEHSRYYDEYFKILSVIQNVPSVGENQGAYGHNVGDRYCDITPEIRNSEVRIDVHC